MEQQYPGRDSSGGVVAGARSSSDPLRNLATRVMAPGFPRPLLTWKTFLAQPFMLRKRAEHDADERGWVSYAAELLRSTPDSLNFQLGCALLDEIRARYPHLLAASVADEVAALTSFPAALRVLLLSVHSASGSATVFEVLKRFRGQYPAPTVAVPPLMEQLEWLRLYRVFPALVPPVWRDPSTGINLSLLWLAGVPPHATWSELIDLQVATVPGGPETLVAVFQLVFHDFSDPNMPSPMLYRLFVPGGPLEGPLPADAPVHIAVYTSSLPDVALAAVLERLLRWRLALRGPADVLVALLSGCAASGRFSLLSSVARVASPGLIQRLDSEPECVAVLERLLVGYPHGPSLFHSLLPALREAVDRAPPDAAHRERLSLMLHCLVYSHPGFPALYAPLLSALPPRPLESVLRIEVQRLAWEGGAGEKIVDDGRGAAELNTGGMVGLVNTGNTCYLNVVLQALFCTSDFRSFVLSPGALAPSAAPDPLEPTEFGDFRVGALRAALRDVVAHLTLSRRKAWEPASLSRALPAEFRSGQQHDATEFARFVTDVARVNDDVFGGRLETAVCCEYCGRESRREERFAQLSLALARGGGRRDLAELVRLHFCPERLSGDNAYRCASEVCGGAKREAVMQARVGSPPANLCVALKRNLADGTKVLDPVSFSAWLDLPELGQPYVLYGAVVHSGSSSRYGHYYLFARHSSEALHAAAAAAGAGAGPGADAAEAIEQRCRQGAWFNFNDSIVSASSFEEAAGVQVSAHSTDVPYMFFYRRAGPEDRERLLGSAGGAFPVPEVPEDAARVVASDNDAYQRELAAERRAALARNGGLLGPGSSSSSSSSSSSRFNYESDYQDPDFL